MVLSWKTNFSGTETRVFRGKIIAGLLRLSIWKNAGYGELDGYLVRFKSQGIFSKTTDILDINGQRVLGTIRISYWKHRAKISYEGNVYEWQFSSWLQKRWEVKNADNHALFHLKSIWERTGEVENEGVPAVVLLASLFVKNYFRKMAAAN